MIVQIGVPTVLPCSILLLLAEVCRVHAQDNRGPSPSPRSDQTAGGGLSFSAVPGIGEITKHKWWVWLLVALGGAFAIVIGAFVIRGVLRYRQAKAREQLKLQAVMKSREEDEELGLGAYKGPPTRLLETDDEDYADVKPWAPASSGGKNPLLLSAFRVPDETSLSGTSGTNMPTRVGAHMQREVERRTGRFGPRIAPGPGPSAPLRPANGLRPAGLQRQHST